MDLHNRIVYNKSKPNENKGIVLLGWVLRKINQKKTKNCISD